MQVGNKHKGGYVAEWGRLSRKIQSKQKRQTTKRKAIKGNISEWALQGLPRNHPER